MGCLTVQVQSVRPTLAATAEAMNVPLSVNGTAMNTPLAINADSRNTPLTVSTRSKNVKIDITIALVCQVSQSDVQLFYVTEGPLIVKEGYFLVKKQ